MKSVRERQTPQDVTHTQNLRNKQTNKQRTKGKRDKQKKTLNYKEQTGGCQRGGGGGDQRAVWRDWEPHQDGQKEMCRIAESLYLELK